MKKMERTVRMIIAATCALLTIACAAPCHARGIFSFFNPEVSTPIDVKPLNSDISGIKTTITLGSLGSMIWPTEHLIIIAFCFLLYAAIRRLGSDYHQRNYLVKAQRISSRLARWQGRFTLKGSRTVIDAEPLHKVAQQPNVTTVRLDCSELWTLMREMQRETDRREAVLREEAEKAPPRKR